MQKILTKEVCLYYQKMMKSSPFLYSIYIHELMDYYNLLKIDAIDVLEGKNIEKIIASYDFNYDTLIKNGFNQEQINQILKAKSEGLDLSFMPTNTPVEEMRNMRIKHKEINDIAK